MKNKVKLIGHYGDDTTIACSAWTSTSRDLTQKKIDRIPALIDMLWGEGHHTPFEKASVHFLVDTDIATHIHLLKHRIASINAESARYKELKEDKYYLPADWSKVMRAGRSVKALGEDITLEEESWMDVLEEYTKYGNTLYHECLKDLEPVLGRARAKESARFFKTYNSQIEADIMINMRSFANFMKLRCSPSAQTEVRELAQEMIDLVRDIPGEPFRFTLDAWNKTGAIK
jgi:thymidylate synthase (FAD)